MFSSQIITSISSIGYSYFTIKLSKSRLNKGLVAIPRSLESYFPNKSTQINIIFDDDIVLPKRFTHYRSSTHESRIGGMTDWFKKRHVGDDDEIVLQVIDIDNYVYRIQIENQFINKVVQLQSNLDNSLNDEQADNYLKSLEKTLLIKDEVVCLNEFNRLAQFPLKLDRKKTNRNGENNRPVPVNLRMLLQRIYYGHCQLCDFYFQKRDGNPYFELHHINPKAGDHPKNLVLVCANCHRQFEYAEVIHQYDVNNWLRTVKFNNRESNVRQALLASKIELGLKNTYI